MPKPLSDGQIVAFVTVLVAVAQVSTSIYLPSLPALTELFATDAATVQWTFTVYMIGAAFSQLVLGPLSDRFGRRPVLLAGLVVYTVASIAAAFAPTVEALIAARLVQSIGATTGPVIGRAIVRDRFDRARGAQVLANVGLALAISPALAPLLGAFVDEAWGWHANFLLVGVFGMTILVLCYRYLAETNPVLQTGAGPRALIGNYGRLLRSRSYLVYALTSSLLFGSMFAFLSEGPFIFIGLLGTSPKAYALYAAIPVAGFAAGSFLTGRYTMRLGIDRMMALGVGVGLAGAVLLAGLAVSGVLTPPAIIGPMTVILLALGVVFPNGMSGALSAHPEIAGTGSALLGFLQMGMAGLAIFSAGWIADGTQIPMVWVMSAGIGAGAAIFLLKPAPRAAPAPRLAPEPPPGE